VELPPQGAGQDEDPVVRHIESAFESRW